MRLDVGKGCLWGVPGLVLGAAQHLNRDLISVLGAARLEILMDSDGF